MERSDAWYAQYCMKWATTFKIHTPHVEDFGKAYYTRGRVNF